MVQSPYAENSNYPGGDTMANSELSKLEILYIYDYFLRHISAYDEDSGITLADLIASSMITRCPT
jgi:hypothetical protein